MKAEKEQVERSAQSIAVTQYGAFIETASCLGSVDRELRSVCDNLAAMLQVQVAVFESLPTSWYTLWDKVTQQHTLFLNLVILTARTLLVAICLATSEGEDLT